LIRLAAIVAILAIAGCKSVTDNVAASVTHEARTWSFVQSVGGIMIDTPVRSEGGGWEIPINANVSGLYAITTKPAGKNSGLACSTSVAVEGSSIYVTVSTEVIAVLKRPECPSVHVEGVLPGRYMVYYRGPGEEPVKLSFIELKPNLR
jgi:hypothetical protein